MQHLEIEFVEKDEKLREKNFKLFTKRYGFMPRIDAEEDQKYSAGKSLSGKTIIYIKGVGDADYLRLNSLYDSDYEAERWADKQDMVNRKTMVALLGISNGSYLGALKKKYRPDTEFFVMEPDESFFSYVCAFVDMTDIISDSNIHLYISEEQIKSMASNMIDYVISFRAEAVGITTPFYSYNDEFTSFCSELERIANSTKNYQMERAADAFKCRMYSWNHLRNAYLIQDLADRLPKGIPAVIVAAGPSLRKNIDVLKQLKGKTLILCTDRAVEVLNEYGIIPDAVTSVDAQKSPEFMDFECAKDVPLICSHQVNIEAQKLFEGRCIFYHQLSYEKWVLGDKVQIIDGLDQGGNVAGGTFAVCKILGIKTIILIGQDLAYVDGRHHADGKEVGAPLDMDEREVEGIDGTTVISNDMWLSFKDFYEREIRQHPDLRVIDATEGGAKIYGTEIMTLQNVADEVCTENYDLKRVFDELPKAQSKEEYLETVKRQEEWIKDLDTIIETSKEVENLCSQLLKISKYQNIADRKVGKKLEKLDDLRAIILTRKVYMAMEEFWITDLYQIPDVTFMVRNNEEAIPVFENAVKFYRNLPDFCNSLKRELQKAIDEGKRDYEE